MIKREFYLGKIRPFIGKDLIKVLAGARRNGKWGATVASTIERKLTATWSPEQIADTVTRGKISFKTIYNWLYQGKLAHVQITVLRQKGKRQNPAKTRGKFSVGASIHERPKEVKFRETFGHWEFGSMVSSRGESKCCLPHLLSVKVVYTQLLKLRTELPKL